jgi:formate dehydrogenase major subunit
MTVHMSGNKLVEIAAVDSEINKGNLCVKGSFEFSPNYVKERITNPMVLNSAGLEEASWETSFEAAVSGLENVVETSGADSIGVVVSPKVTNETAYMAAKLAGKALGTNNFQVMGQTAPELTSYITDNEAVSFDKLEASDLIVLFNADVANEYPVIAQRIRKAVARGTSLVIVSDKETKLDRRAVSRLALDGIKDLEVLKQFVSAQNVFIICDSQNVTIGQLKFLNDLAPEKNISISILEPAGNYRGIRIIGADQVPDKKGLSYNHIIKGVKDGTIKGLVIIADEDGIDSQLLANNNIFTVVITPVAQDELANARVVLPGTAFVETRGSYTNSEGKQQIAANALMPLAGREVWGILSELVAIITKEDPTEYDKLTSEVNYLFSKTNIA